MRRYLISTGVFAALALAGPASWAQTATVSVSKMGTGSGRIVGRLTSAPPTDPYLIDCGAVCSASVPSHPLTVIRLTAIPDPGSVFGGWRNVCGATPMVAESCDVAPGHVEAQFDPKPGHLHNISTRAQVMTGDDVLIGGFIMSGPGRVVIRARGPSLAQFGITNPLQDPEVRLVRSLDNAMIASNDNWSPADIPADVATTFAYPFMHERESLIFANLGPGGYTAIMSGVGATTGVGIVEVFDFDSPDRPLINISARAHVGTGDDVVIGGFIVGGFTDAKVLIRGRGPSLAQFGVANHLANPQLRIVRQSDGVTVATNDNWQDDPGASQMPGDLVPTNSLEAATLLTLPPGGYTAILSGVGGGTGVGIVEVFFRPF